jgi:hypothetical protein
MTKFKCKISDLQSLVKLVSSKGKNIDGKEYSAITDCIMDVQSNSIVVKAMDIQHTFLVKVEYKNIDVLEQGQLPIGDLTNFASILTRFDPMDVVTLYTQENKLYIERAEPKKVAKLPLVSIDAISSSPATPLDGLKRSAAGYPATDKIALNLKIVTNTENISSIFEDGNVIKERIIPIKVEQGKFKVAIGSEIYGSFETESTADLVVGDGETIGSTESSFGNGLDNIFSNLSGKVVIYLADKSTSTPLCVEQSTDSFNYLALLAPYATVG